MRTRTLLALGLLALSSSLGCKAPDRRAGVFVEHPEHWGANLVAIHHATFSDNRPNIRIRTTDLGEAGLVVANLEYPTSGKRNRDIEGLIEGHLAFVRGYLGANPEARVTFVGFSQGGCLELDIVERLARAEPALIERASMLLVAPARGVKTGKSTQVAKGMIARCERAEASLDELATGAPEGVVAKLLHERTYLTWSCNDAIVGHDTFTSLGSHIPAEHMLYQARLGHIPWASKQHEAKAEDADVPYGPQIQLATALARAIAEGLEPRETLAGYVDFDSGCS